MYKELATLLINQVDFLDLEKEVNLELLTNDYKKEFLELSETNNWEFWHMVEGIGRVIKNCF